MRTLVALVILLLGFNCADQEPQYSGLFDEYLPAADHATPALIEIESSIGRGDRLVATRPSAPIPVAEEIYRPGDPAVALALASPDIDVSMSASSAADGANANGTEPSVEDLCQALFTSAQDNDLPIPFFANLIWQESRLRDDAVSKKGALGIAQFMPKVASEKGLDNPLDPMQALPASARFLHELKLQFGNLGFVAAAYNAGARRVAEWLERRGSLPRETRDYVVRVTGLSVDAWRTRRVDSDALTFVRHLPCRSLPAFATMEQAQAAQAQANEAKPDPARHGDAPAPHQKAPHSAARKDPRPHEREARQKHRETQREARRAGRERHAAKGEAEHASHAARDKRRSV